MLLYGRGQERKVSVLHSMEAWAKMIRKARARAGETVKRRRLAARAVDAGAAADAAPLMLRQQMARCAFAEGLADAVNVARCEMLAKMGA